MHIELFDARMLAPLVSYLEKNGARAEPFLDRACIPVELIESGGWVTKSQAYDFTFDVVRQSRCPDAVFSAYLSFELKHLGPIIDAMKSCKTVKESLEVGARLGSTAYEGNEYFLEIDGDTTWFCYREPNVVSAGQTFINDMTLTVYFQLIRAMADEDWRPERLRSRGVLIDRHRSLEIFENCRSSIHPDSSGLAFPTEFLGRRLPSTIRSTEFDRGVAWTFGPDGSEPIVDTLYRLITSQFPYRKLPTLDEVASMLDVSVTTLKRQFQAAGTSYLRLLDRIRFDAACEMLSIPQMTVHEISQELGYSGTNNFVRAFRRLTGMTPGEHRRRHVLTNSQH